MKLLVAFTARCVEVNGAYYNPGGALLEYGFLQRFLHSIPDAEFIIRCRPEREVKPGWARIDGEHVGVVPIPDTPSFAQTLLRLPRTVRYVLRAIRECDRYYVQMPEIVGIIVGLLLWVLRKKYAVEVIADAMGSVTWAKRQVRFVRLYAWIIDRLSAFVIWRARCATYVSQYLRQRYPNREPSHTWVFCSAELADEWVGRPRDAEFFRKGPLRILSVGRLSAEKDHFTLIRAFAEMLRMQDRSGELHLVGIGPEQDRLKRLAEDLGIAESVRFWGHLPRGQALHELFDTCHVFVMPSRSEGMGRALVEAMSKGMAALGSRIGGIPELLEPEALFPAGDERTLARKMAELAGKPELLEAMSRRNFEAAQRWRPAAIEPIKDEFWRNVVASCS